MYCVYFHKTPTGEIFYIGHGRIDRAYSKSYRNKLWKIEISKFNKFDIEIYKNNLSKEEAFILESELITKIKPRCNVKTKQSLRLIIPANFKELFYIDSSSPSGLRYLVPNESRSFINKREKDDIAGNIKYQNDGRLHGWQIMVSGKSYLVHRIIWKLANNTFNDNYVIDHIDQNPLNNKLENLREVDYRKNANNSKIRITNSTGIKQLYIKKYLDYKSYVGQRWVDGKRFQKSFSFRKFGEEKAKQLAIDFINFNS